MSCRKKQTYAQQAVGLATMGLPLPSPVQKFFTTRLGALLFVVAVPALIATGVITVTFNNGMPSVQFNQQRAAVVKFATALLFAALFVLFVLGNLRG